MPNQFTKFRDASKSSGAREFRFRECSGKKNNRPQVARKRAPRVSPEDCKVEVERRQKASGTLKTGTKDTPSSSLLQYLPSGGLRIDPFQSYPVAPDHSELHVLDHFLYILSPSGKHNPGNLHKRRTQHVDPHINLLLPYIMHEAPLFDAMLATCQASIALSSGLSAYTDRFFVLHRGRAMAGLREKLEGLVDTSSLLIVSLLITCDYMTGDLKAVAGHSKALQRMVDLRGGLPDETPWDRFVKAGVKGYKAIGYLATGAIPAGDLARSHLDEEVDPLVELHYPELPFSPGLCDRWAELPSGFCELGLASQLSTQLLSIIYAINGIRGVADEDFDRALDLVQPVQAALQRFSQHNQATYVERCVAAGLLAYTFQHPRVQNPNMFHDPPMLGFVRLFSVAFRVRSKCEQDLMIWAHMAIEGFASARSSRLPGSHEMFKKAVTKYGALKEWAKLQSVLRRFFWTPELLERWKTCHTTMTTSSTPIISNVRHATSVRSSLADSDVMIIASPAMCPISGQLATISNGEVARCPFQPQ